jgi:hypothetical protein
MGREDRAACNFGEDLGKGIQINRGGQGNLGNWRPKVPAKDKSYYQVGKALEIKCFRCLGIDHHQSDCTKDPVCYKCKQKGHMAVDCGMAKGKSRCLGSGFQVKVSILLRSLNLRCTKFRQQEW